MKHNGLYYEIKGTGEPIIFLHGIGGTHNMFEPQVQVLSRFAQTITVDLKGHGQSENVKTTNYLDVHCQSILDLMNHLNIEKAMFVGLSYGGIVTQTFTTKYPEKVKKMVLIDTYGCIIPRTPSQLSLMLFGLFIVGSTVLPYRMLNPLFKQYEQWELAYETMKYNYKTRNRFHMLLQLTELIGKNYLYQLRSLTTPALVIVGDAYSSVVEKSVEICENLPNSELLIVKDSMDPSNLCKPEEVNEAILAFMRPELIDII